MYFVTWNSLKEKVFQRLGEKLTKQALKDKIVMSWEKILIKEIRKCISVWKRGPRLVLDKDGSHIKHRLK